MSRAMRIFRSFRSSDDSSMWSIFVTVFQTRKSGDRQICLIITSDVDARASHTEFARHIFPKQIQRSVLFFSSYVLRRSATLSKIILVRILRRLFGLTITVFALDGIGNLRIRNLGWISHLHTEWFNSPDEADHFWSLIKSKPDIVTEFFPFRDGLVLASPSASHERKYSWPVTALVMGHTQDLSPSVHDIVFAGDIRLDVRPECNALLLHLEEYGFRSGSLDEVLWAIAEERVAGKGTSQSIWLSDVLQALTMDTKYAGADVESVTDGLRLTVHSRERFLYVRNLCRSEFSKSVRIIGHQWLQFKEVAPYVASSGRFPESWPPSDFQRARVCPDFGSSLGMIPNYLRAQILAAKAGGLVQLKSHLGNPFLEGLESNRTFVGMSDLLAKIDRQFTISEESWLDEIEAIRANYRICQDSYIESLSLGNF